MISLCDYLLPACFRQKKQNKKNEPSVTKHEKFSLTYASLFFQHTLQILVTYNHLIKPLLRHKTMCFVFGLDAEEENLSWSAQTCTGNNRRHTVVNEYLALPFKCQNKRPSRNKQRWERYSQQEKFRKRVYLQMEILSCLGGRGPAASGMDIPGRLASYTCLHLGASMLEEQQKVSNLLI